jgi:hypothetical protein
MQAEQAAAVAARQGEPGERNALKEKLREERDRIARGRNLVGVAHMK